MQFFCFHGDRVGSRDLRIALAEQHWAYMDDFASRLFLRGPTFDDQEALTGSIHVVDMDSAEQAWAFALREPGYQAGVYRDVMIRRWRDVLGRSMWDYPTRSDPDGLFMVMGFEPEPAELRDDSAPDADLVAFGHLLSDDGGQQLGTVAILRAQNPLAACAVLDGLGLTDVEVRRWRFGGRR